MGNKYFCENVIISNSPLQALYQVTVLLVLNFKGTSILHLEGERRQHASDVKNTMIFNAFVLSQVSILVANACL